MSSEKMEYILRRAAKSAMRTDILKSIISEIKSGKVPVEEVAYFDGCMAKIAKMDAYEDYGSPFCVSDWKKYKGK